MKLLMRAWVVCLFALIVMNNALSAQRNWLAGQATLQQMGDDLSGIIKWRQSQKQTVLQAVQSLPDTVKKQLIQNADRYQKFDWPNLPATTFLEFGENGNRTRYENIRRRRRQALSALTIGLLIKGDSAYLPAIVNGIWAICEESTWAYPAHLSLQRKYSPLPNPGENILDLGNGSTSELMSWVYLLIRPELDKLSGVVAKRIYFELEKRVMEPYLTRSDFWWMGFKGQSVNNWNPFVNNSVLLTALLVEKNQGRLDSVVHKTMLSVDNFINQYPEDGGCDEGPGYWSMASGALIGYLSKLKSATRGKIDIASQPLIGRMGAFIYQSNIDGHYFVNYGDAHGEVTPNVSALYQFGETCKNDTLKQFAAWYANQGGTVYNYLLNNQDALESFLDYLPICQSLINTKAALPFVKQSWLPDLEQLTVRTEAGTAQGLFLGAKGGTNGASHNHNDVGNFIIYVNGKPAIIDLGVGTYTKQTFSKERYQIFTMQSAWHNLPTINGFMQKDGKAYRAQAVELRQTKGNTALSMDLTAAYPKEAAIGFWKRNIAFSGTAVELTASYQLKKYVAPSVLSLITPLTVTTGKDFLLLKDIKTGKGLKIAFDSKALQPEVEAKVFADPSLIHSWGKQVYRIQFKVRSEKLKGQYKIRFTEL